MGKDLPEQFDSVTILFFYQNVVKNMDLVFFYMLDEIWIKNRENTSGNIKYMFSKTNKQF